LGTIPYFGRSLATVYAGNLNPGVTKYYCNASSFQTLCAAKDSAMITVMPTVASVVSAPSFVCVNGSAVLYLNAATVVPDDKIKWQQSSDSINFTDMPGIVGLTCTTAVSSNNMYYRAIISNETGATCYTTPAYFLEVRNPQPTSTSGSSVCAVANTATFTLTANGTTGTTFKWYAQQTGGSALGTAAVFTPSAAANTTYYVGAIQDGCEGTRVAVEATISNPPVLTINASSQTVCNNAITALSVTSSASDYTSFTWSPATGLYTDASATTPYVSGTSATTVYAKTSATGNNIFTVMANNSSSNCWMSLKDTVFVLPSTTTASSLPVCNGGKTTISLTPATGYGAGSLQWQISLNGSTYTDIAGANGTSYMTDSLTSSTNYQVLIKDQTGQICGTVTHFAVVNQPQITSAIGAARCGTGSVTLTATSNGGTISWFDVATGGTALLPGGSSYSPSISVTKTYYASVTSNGCSSLVRVPVVAEVSAPPTLSLSASRTICSNSITQLSVTSTLSNYDSYKWSPASNLYSDADATVAYVTGTNTNTVYVKNAVAGTYNYSVAASNTETGCATNSGTSVTVMPSSVSTSSSPASICKSGSATISLSPSTGYGSGTIQWQMSMNGTTYTDIAGASNSSYTTPDLNTVSYYQAVIKDEAGNSCLTSAPYTLSISNPQVESVTGASRCGTGSSVLSATASTGTIKWYNVETGGNALKTASTYTTPSSTSATTTYYVGLTVSGCEGTRTPVVVNVSTPLPLTLSSTSQTVSCDNPVVAMSVTSDVSNYDTYVWTPASGLFMDSAATTPYVSGTSATTVYAVSAVAGTKVYTVTANNVATLCANTATSSVTVTSLSPVTVSPVYATLCANEVKAISVTSDTTNYSTYTWSPVDNLFTDADATIPYVANTSATSVYAKASASGAFMYTVNAASGTSACVGAASAKLYVLPTTGNISSSVTSICKSGSATLTLNTTDTLPAGSVQWQMSLNGSAYSDISGANALTYNTGTITTSTYYRAVVSSPSGICFTTNGYMQLVNNPTIVSTVGGARCGSGSVTLSAVASNGASISWYSAATGGSSLASGSTYSPSISATKDYYVGASIGSCNSAVRVAVTATIAPPIPVAMNSAKTVCNAAVTSLNVASAPENYESYVWSPRTNLYLDADATVAYDGSSASMVYFKSNTAGKVVYSITAVNNTSGCTTVATDTVTVQGTSASIYSNQSAICKTGTAKLSLNTSSRPMPGTVQWTLNGVDIAGANDSAYTTPTITATSTYQAIIKDGSGNTCFTTPAFTQVVNNPSVASVADVSRCAAGSVTLNGTASQDASLNWYSVSSGGTKLATGNSYTANVTATTTFYVSASIGTTCESSPRTAVVATVNPATPVTIAMGASGKTKTVCNAVTTQIDVTSTLTNYDTYTWLPVAGLYTDAAATVPYVAGTNATTVYVNRTLAGQVKYIVTASNATSGCYAFDTATVNVQPASAIITSNPAAICISGTASMSLSPSTGYAASTIKWQESADSTSFIDIAGANTTSITSAANTADRFYRAIVIDGSSSVCFTSDYRLNYRNPSISAPFTNITRCGSGTVTLKAYASNGATVRWYDAAVGGNSIAPETDSTVVTPVVASTTVFYASAEIAGCFTPRIADTVTVSTPPSVSVTAPQTVCNNTIVAYSIDQDPTYSSYVWTPATNLYTDADATVPYVAGTSASTLYARSATAGTTNYTISASGNECSVLAATSLSVQLLSATITSNPAVLCVNGTAVMSLSPSSPYGLGSIQWQRSVDSINWVSSPGAVGVTYTTPLQADTRYYRALVKDGSGNTCFTATPYKLVISNPLITSVSNATVCGIQPATLSATSTANSTIKWYASLTSTQVLGTGESFTTPAIAVTTTFYAQAFEGICSSARYAVVANYNPAPSLTITPTRMCVGETKAMSAEANLNNYSTFTWSPVDNLYMDSAATIPYVAGTNAAVVYYKGSTAAFTQYTLSASNPTTGCVNTITTSVDNIFITFSNITATPASVCQNYPVSLSAYSSVITSGPQTMPTGYLASSATSPNDEEILRVRFGSLDQSSDCNTTGGPGSTLKMYSNYTETVPAPTVSVGDSVDVAVTVSYCGSTTAYSNSMNVYVDWNRDGDFADQGENTIGKAYGPASLTGTNYAGKIRVPDYAQAGVTRMRVVLVESSTINPTGTYTWGETEDYAINVRGYVAQNPNYVYTWNVNNLTGANVIDTPRTAGVISYIVTASDPIAGCPASDTIDVTVYPTPGAPIVANSIQCGFGVPQAYVVSSTGSNGTFKWYDAATGGNLLQTGGYSYSSSINNTTTFYVSESTTTCEGPRSMVIATVNQPDAVQATANSAICLNGSVSLGVTQTATNNNYTNYIWKASPSTGSGISDSLIGSTQSVTPTIAGTYVYSVVAKDSSCATISTVTVTVNKLPLIDSITATASSICDGNSTTLSVYSNTITTGPQELPSGYCATAGGGTTSCISEVTFNTMSNTSACAASPYYTDFGTSASITTVTVGQSYPLTLTTSSSAIISVWFDWNRNGSLEANEWVQPFTTGTTGTLMVTVPQNAVAGFTKMRVRSRGSGNTNGAGDACTSFASGESEDYIINVRSGVSQNPDLLYAWSSGDSGLTTTIAPNATTNYTVTVTNPVTGCVSTGTKTVTVNPIPATPNGASSDQCGDAYPTATVTSNNNFAVHTYKWYDAPTGGNLVQTETTNRSYTRFGQIVSRNDTLYVSEVSEFGCESGRATVYFNVTIPDSIHPTVTASSFCLGSSITLKANQEIGGSNTYQFTWSASPTTGSGIDSSIILIGSDSLTITPTVAGTYNYSVVGFDQDRGCTIIRSLSVIIDGGPKITSVTANQDSICAGSDVILTATTSTVAPGNATIGNGTIVNSTTSYPTPFGQFYGSSHEQYLIRASELTAAGLVAGDISSIAWNLSAGYNYAPLENFQINMAHTNLNSMTSALLATGFTNVVPLRTYSPSAVSGYSTINFANSFNWDGVSNVVVDVSFSNCSVCTGTTSCTTSFTNNGAVTQSATSYVSTVNYHADGNCTINSFTPSNTGTTYSQRPNMRFKGQKVTAGAGSLNWTWNPGAQNSAVVTVAPTTTTTYSVTATDPLTGCTSAAQTVTITAMPIPAAPSANNSVQCGYGIPSIVATSNSTNIGTSVFNWYDTLSSSTTTFFSNDFSTTSLNGATLSGTAVLNNNSIRLTPNTANSLGGLTVNANGVNAQGYNVSFTMTTGGGGGADGLSYSFADDADANATSPNAENGTGTKLVIGFDDYGTGAGANGIRVLYNSNVAGDIGTTIGTNGIVAYSDNTDWIGQSNVPVVANINQSGQLNLIVGGTPIFTNLQLPAAYVNANKASWRHVFKARTGGLSMVHSIDNVNLQYYRTGFIANGTAPNLPISQSTNYYVSEVSSFGCEGPRTQVVAHVNQPDSITASVNNNVVCPNSNIELSVSNEGTTNDYSFSWSASPSAGSGISASVSGAQVSAVPTAPGSYTYTVTAYDAALGCTNLASVTVTVNESPKLDSVTTTAVNICNGGTALLTAYSGAIANGPQNLPTGYLASNATSTADEDILGVTFGPLSNSSTCSSTGTTGSLLNQYSNFTNLPAPTMTVGETYPLTVNVGTCGGNFSNWTNVFIDYNRNGAFEANERVFTSPASVQGPHTESGTVTIPTNATPGVTLMRVIVREFGTATDPATGTYTWGETEDYKLNIRGAVSQVPGNTFTWSSTADSTGSTLTVNPSETTTYSVYATSYVGCQSETRSVTVNVIPVSASINANVTTLCVGQSAMMVATASGYGTLAYSWSDGSSVIGSSSSINVTPASTTTYMLTVTDPCGNVDTAYQTITVNALPSASIDGNSPVVICDLNTNEFTASTNSSDASFQWTLNGANISGANGDAYTANVGGTYRVKVTDNITGCVKISDGAVLSVLQIPSVVNITPSSVAPIYGGTVVTLNGSATQNVSGVIGTEDTTLVTSGNPYRAGLGYPNVVRTRMLLTASQLNGLGIAAGNITSLGFTVKSSSGSMQKLRIAMGVTTSTSLNGTTFSTQSLTDTVFRSNGSFIPAIGLNNHVFNTPFVWNGTSNILVDFVQQNLSSGTCVLAANKTDDIMGVQSTSQGIQSLHALPIITLGAQSLLPVTWTSTGGLDTTISSISVMPTFTTTYTATVTNSLGCTRNNSVTIPVIPSFNVKAYLEGFYTGNNTMIATLRDLLGDPDATATDSVRVNLWRPDSLSNTSPEFSIPAIIHTNGTINANMPQGSFGNTYYISVTHRNSIETWSSVPVTVQDSTVFYDFTTGLGQAYGDGINSPMKDMGGVYAMYSGNVDQDPTIDINDMSATENDAFDFAFGYNATDCNGDGASDALDMQIIENNAILQIYTARPY